MLRTIEDIAITHCRPALEAVFFGRHLPRTLRWRLLALQPIIFLTHSLALAPYLFRRPYAVRYVPVSHDRSLRVLVFKVPGAGSGRNGLRPLHVDCHPSGFVGGIPESDASICELVAKRTGASAGGNLVLAASQRVPASGPYVILLPLYGSYAAPAKAENWEDPRMSPCLAREESLQERMLLVVAAIDITVHEQLTFVERVKRERDEQGKDGGSVEAPHVEDAFHGCLEGDWRPLARRIASSELA
ncbi:lipase esterase family [Colletotrichum plurivorum]|uniref:Lipase esterase family n=1 Tax=Colletotrichum plurivorum TaxID=2175906 RepID=A0A8H6KQZ0_9PEZI|nr:lipase esterase family [Colletotrichum plurivorum]